MKEIKHTTIEVGMYEVNCTILEIGDKAWIVDPGSEGERISELILSKGLSAEAILLTHAHFDHIGAIPFLQRRFPGLPVYVGKNDIAVINHPMNQLPPEYPPLPMPDPIEEASSISGKNGMETIETPGHTPGGVCYFLPGSDESEPLLLSGDTLFAGSVGRTDFPGGDMSKLYSSLKKLAVLPENTIVIPGHGRITTIGEELKLNPFLSF